MRKVAIVIGLMLLATSLIAGGGHGKSWTGYVTDAGCAAKGKGGATHAGCAEKCLSKEGSKAVLVTDEGSKVVQIANQEKLKGHAGHHVKVTGKLEGDTLTVDKVTMVEESKKT